MRTLIQFVFHALASIGLAPLAIGFDLPGAPGQTPVPDRQPIWIPMSKSDFSFFEMERELIENAKACVTSKDDWKNVFGILYNNVSRMRPFCDQHAIFLNNMAFAAYQAGRSDIAKIVILQAKQLTVTNQEIRNAIDNNLSIFD